MHVLGPRRGLATNSFVHVGSFPGTPDPFAQVAEAPPPYDPDDIAAAQFPAVFAPPGGAYPGPPPTCHMGVPGNCLHHGDVAGAPYDVTGGAVSGSMNHAAIWYTQGPSFSGCQPTACILPALVMSVILILLDFSMIWYGIHFFISNDGLSLVDGFYTTRYIFIAYGVITAVIVLVEFFTLEVTRKNLIAQQTPAYYTPDYIWRRCFEDGLHIIVAALSDLPVFIGFLVVHTEEFCPMILFLESLEGFLVVMVSFIHALWRVLSPMTCTCSDLGRPFQGTGLRWCESWVRVVRICVNLLSVVMGLVLIVISIPPWHQLFSAENDPPDPVNVPVFMAQRLHARYVVKRHFNGNLLPPAWTTQKTNKHVGCWGMKFATCDHLWGKIYVGNRSDITNRRNDGYRSIPCEKSSPFFLSMLEPSHARLYNEGKVTCRIIFRLTPVGNRVLFNYAYEIHRIDPGANIAWCLSGRLTMTNKHNISDIWSLKVLWAIRDFECGYDTACSPVPGPPLDLGRLKDGYQPVFSCADNSKCDNFVELTKDSFGPRFSDGVSEHFLYMPSSGSHEGTYAETLNLNLCSNNSRTPSDMDFKGLHVQLPLYTSCEEPRVSNRYR